MNNPFQHEALNYATGGFRVLPVHSTDGEKCGCGDEKCSSPGKHPIPPSGLREGTADVQRVGIWSRQYPNANLGICTGKLSRIFVLDIDKKHNGLASLESLEKQFGPLPQTVTARTGGGGKHYFFRYPDRKIGNRAGIRPGIDVRGEGGYVVVPPSNHMSGQEYEWEPGCGLGECEIAQASDWLLDLIQPQATEVAKAIPIPVQPASHVEVDQTRRRLQGYVEGCPGVAEGERNQTGFNMACRFREIAEESLYPLSSGELLELLQNWNGRNSPPLDDAEISKIANSAIKHQLSEKPLPTVGNQMLQTPISLENPAESAIRVRPFKAFPVQLLPYPVNDFVAAAASAIGCDPSYIALPLIAAIGAAIGNTRRIQLKRGWNEPPIFWTAFIGESGTAKSPAMTTALKALEKLQSSAFDRYQIDYNEYESDRKFYKIESKAWEKELKNGDLADRKLPPIEPIRPVMERYYCSDTTIEALAPLLLNQPRGLLMKRDELAGWIGNFDRYSQGKGADVAQWLEMFNAGNVTIDRKTGDLPFLFIPRASVCVTGGIQPAILKRALQPEYQENGLAARLLFAYPPRQPKKWTEAEIPLNLESEISNVFERLYNLEFAQDEDGKRCPVALPLSPEGKKAFIQFYNEHNNQQMELAGELAAAWSKLEGYAARFALIVQLIRSVTMDETLESSELIDEKSIDAGVQLSRWFGDEALRVYEMLACSDEERKRLDLVDWIRNRGDKVTAREVQAGHRKLKTSEQAKEALQELVDLGLGVWVNQPPSPQGGPPTRQFVLALAA